MIIASWRQTMENMEHILSHPSSIFWDDFLKFFFLIFQNQSVAGNVNQQIKK